MKPAVFIILAALFIVGIGGGYMFLADSDDDAPPAPAAESSTADAASLHGKQIEIPKNAVLCATHRVPEVICPFCTPSLIEERGHCGGHDVAEALCTRCTPALIAAFKVEGDWCAEHGLPESQCLTCNPPTSG